MLQGFKHSTRWHVSVWFIASALLCLPFADLGIYSYDPWSELGRLLGGVLQPTMSDWSEVAQATIQTFAFALLGVGIGSVCGFALALVFHWRWVRVLCALLRAVHELFWALILMQIFGLHPLTGLLALAIPYTATFAKVYAEILEEGGAPALATLSPNTTALSAFLYTRLPDLWSHIKTYTAYRMECGLRSSAVLGFVGLPTLGYSLSSAFMQGQYAQVWGLLLLFYLLIATMPYWLKPKFVALSLVIAPFVIDNDQALSMDNVVRFFTQDIIPAPILQGGSFFELWSWLTELWLQQAWPGIINTLLLSQMALVLTGVLSLLLFPLISRYFFKRLGRTAGHVFLVVMRSTPEYILAFILLLLWGPSMLPAVVALALHNAGIIGHLLGRYSNELQLRADVSRGVNTYSYELLPRVYGQFLAFLFYRWEVIFRETAILGILGIATLGFYIDSAIQEVRIDRAMVLILITALLNVVIDSFARWLRRRLQLNSAIEVR